VFITHDDKLPSIARRALRRGKNASAKQKRRQAFFGQQWQHEGTLSRRRYDSYDSYVQHQRAKLDKVAGELQDGWDGIVDGFKRRLRLAGELGGRGTVLCLGARLGHEVKAFHELGYFAVGIDLNPGADNPYVLPGDFHALAFPDGSVDVVYTNCLDHAFDLPRILAEVSRVLKPDGVFVADIVHGYEEGYMAGAYEATYWPRAAVFAEHLAKTGGFRLAATRELAAVGAPHWMQAVLLKQAPAHE
jgi:SAM-dependent methyltransferase